MVLGILLLSSMTVRAAEGPATQEEEVALLVRSLIRQDRDPQRVAEALAEQTIRLLGFQERRVTFLYDGKEVRPISQELRVAGPDLKVSVVEQGAEVEPTSGEKADLTLTMWLYEWAMRDGSYREQAVISGYWSSTEYSWIDDPADVIDVRWIVGDVVYLSSAPYDGIQRDQHTLGIASFTVDDQVQAWDLFVNFRPASSNVHGRWSNIFLNYTHTWWGATLSISLGAGPSGNTGSIDISTNAQTWTEGTGLAFRIGSGQTRGPVQTGEPARPAVDREELR